MRCGFFVVMGLLASSALAHGGDEHGEAHASGELVRGEVHSLGALGDAFEVVLKHPAHGLGGALPLRLFVAEADSNAPVSGAQVELTLTGPSVQALKPKMDSPGVYLAQAELPVGVEFSAVATVTRGETVDVLALGSLHLEPVEVASSVAGRPLGGWGFFAGAVGLAALVWGSWWVRRRLRRSVP